MEIELKAKTKVMTTSTALVALFVAALAAIVVLGIALYRTTAEFPERRLQFQTSLLVQLLGSIVFGAIVTYSIYVIQHAQQAEEKHIADLQIAADNKTRVLRFIKDELSYNLAALKARDGSIDVIGKNPLKSDFWKISGLSGDLKWIEDVELLNLIAQAYFEIENDSALEARYIDASIGTGSTITLTFSNGQQLRPQAYIGSIISQTYASSQASINAALKRL